MAEPCAQKRRKLCLPTEHRPAALAIAAFALEPCKLDKRLKRMQAFAVLGVPLEQQSSSWSGYAGLLVEKAFAFFRTGSGCPVTKGGIQFAAVNLSQIVSSMEQCANIEIVIDCIDIVARNLNALYDNTLLKPQEPFSVCKQRLDQLRATCLKRRQEHRAQIRDAERLRARQSADTDDVAVALRKVSRSSANLAEDMAVVHEPTTTIVIIKVTPAVGSNHICVLRPVMRNNAASLWYGTVLR